MDFPSTIWTVIRGAQNDPRGARELVIRRYWDPVFRYAQIKGLSREDAEDMTQTVFVHLCRDGFLERADRNKGRFRGLIVAVTENLIKQWWRNKYVGAAARVAASLDDERLLEIADTSPGVNAEFDRVWSENVLAQAMARLREESSRLKTPYHRAVEAFYLEGKSYVEIASELHVAEAQVKNYVFRGKARLGDLVREFIREYCGSAEEFEGELHDLQTFLESRPS